MYDFYRMKKTQNHEKYLPPPTMCEPLVLRTRRWFRSTAKHQISRSRTQLQHHLSLSLSPGGPTFRFDPLHPAIPPSTKSRRRPPTPPPGRTLDSHTAIFGYVAQQYRFDNQYFNADVSTCNILPAAPLSLSLPPQPALSYI